MKGYTVSQLARAAGVGGETVRHYEQIGLLPKAERSDSGYRLFPETSLARLSFIRRAKSLGFGLPEIIELLRLSDQRQSPEPSDMVQLREAASAKLADVDVKLAELQRVRAGLVELIGSCPGEGSGRECPILAALSDDDAGQSKNSPTKKPKKSCAP